jgi:hypothetical protein
VNNHQKLKLDEQQNGRANRNEMLGFLRHRNKEISG